MSRRPFFPTQEYPILQNQPVPALNFILYLEVNYTIVDGMITSYYDSSCGTYNNVSGIADFIQQLLAGTLPPPDVPLSPGTTPTIKYPSYVVFAIAKNGPAQLRQTHDAVATNDGNGPEYVNLVQVLDDGALLPGNNLGPLSPPAPPSPCHVAYFCAAVSPSENGANGIPDLFNLHIIVPQPDGSVWSGTIDPDIKDTGHPTITGSKRGTTVTWTARIS